jgi:hypothetical protein
MDQQELEITFEGCDQSDASRFAQDLEQHLLEVAPTVDVKLKKARSDTQDFGTTLVRDLATARLGEKMMEREGEEESYRISLQDTISLYDTLVYGIVLPELVVAAINRKTEQYYISEEYRFRVEREKRESERKTIEAEGIREFQQIVSHGISESYLRWRGIEATLQLSQSTNSKVVIIGSTKDGLPIILGNLDTPPSSGSSATSPKDRDTTAKETITAASPEVPLKKTSAAALPTPNEKMPPAASTTGEAAPPDRPRSLWPL